MKKRKPGRPSISINSDLVGQMAFDGAKNSEIAAVLGIDDQTINNRFSLILTKKRSERRAALRKKQTTMALHGNIPMLIWLGKQELDQREPKQDIDFEGALPLRISIVPVKSNGPKEAKS
jgi:hypothetical protein